MHVLFIGGTGTISSACVRLALERGLDVAIVNRGISDRRALPSDVEFLAADASDAEQMRSALSGRDFSAVVDFRAFTAGEVRARLDLFRGRAGQYVFISSATVYQKPPAQIPILESTPLTNPGWSYAENKIACEELLTTAYRQERYPVTIVRPSHTYDERTPPIYGGWTQIERMRQGKPVIVHGDGTSLWTLTHSRDFAVGLLGLIGDARAFGHAFHITSDEVLPWNQIFEILGAAAGAPRPRLVHIASETIARADAEWGHALLGDMAHSLIFDNSKIRRFSPDFTARTPFAVGAREVIAWFDGDPSHRRVDQRLDTVVETMLASQPYGLPESPSP